MALPMTVHLLGADWSWLSSMSACARYVFNAHWIPAVDGGNYSARIELRWSVPLAMSAWGVLACLRLPAMAWPARGCLHGSTPLGDAIAALLPNGLDAKIREQECQLIVHIMHTDASKLRQLHAMSLILWTVSSNVLVA